MNRSTRLAISAAVIGLALGLVAGLPPWPERTVMVTISLLLLAAAAFAAMWALLTIDEGLVTDPDEPAQEAPAVARIHHLTIVADAAGNPRLAYTPVADVATGDAEEAFARSQNIDSSWIEGEGVTPIACDSSRSTSVGDVIELAGSLVIVEPIGFADVSSFDAALEHARTTSFLALLLPKTAVAQGRFVS